MKTGTWRVEPPARAPIPVSCPARYNPPVLTRRICPWCRSELAREAGVACPVCARPLVDESGNALREVDLVYDRVVAAEREKRKAFLIRGTPVAALVSLGGPLIHGALAFIVSVPLFMLAHGIALRLVLVREPRRLLGRRRRFFARHIARGIFLVLTAIGYSLTSIPAAGAVAGAITFAGVTWLTQEHLMWSLRQERLRHPPHAWEKIALTALVLLVLGLLALLAAFGLAAWAILERLTGA